MFGVSVTRNELNKRQLHFGIAWSVLFVPLLFAGAALSIPYGAVAKLVLKRRERKFLEFMKSRDRTVALSDIGTALKTGSGTLLFEVLSKKGPCRCWWTEDDVYASCPHRLVSPYWCLTPEASGWLRRRYLSPQGEAHLIFSREDNLPCRPDVNGLYHKMRWLEVGPV